MSTFPRVEAREGAEEDADGDVDSDGDDADGEGDTGAVEQANGDITRALVYAEPVARAGALEALEACLPEHVRHGREHGGGGFTRLSPSLGDVDVLSVGLGVGIEEQSHEDHQDRDDTQANLADDSGSAGALVRPMRRMLRYRQAANRPSGSDKTRSRLKKISTGFS